MSVRDTQFSGDVIAEGVRKAYGKQTVLDGVDLRVEAGTVHALLGPNGAGKTTMVRILSTLVPPDAGRVTVGRARRGPPAQAGARGHRRDRPVRRGRRAAHRRGEPAAHGQARAVGPVRCAPAGGRAARAVRPRRRPDETCQDVFGRHAAPARPRGQPDRPSAGDLPGRADDRPRPAQPAGHVGHHRATWSVRGPRSCSRPSTWRRPTAWPAGSRSSITARWWPRARPRSSSPASPRNRWSCTSPRRSTSPRAGPSSADDAHADEGERTIAVDTDGSAEQVRAVLDRLALAAVPVQRLSLRRPTLDDVFLELTGGPRA